MNISIKQRLFLVVILSFLDIQGANAELQVSIEPAEAITAGAQWRVDGGAWLNSGDTYSATSAGKHTIEFYPLDPWSEPQSLELWDFPGATIQRQATYKPLASYSVGGIAPQIVWHHQVLEFLVTDALDAIASPLPAGAITFDSGTGLFRYAPDPTDTESFYVTFQADAGTDPQIVEINPMAVLLPEAEMFGGDTDVIGWITRDDFEVRETQNAPESFNHRANVATRNIRIVGENLVFESGHANSIYDNYHANENIKTFEVFCDELIIRNPLHLPQTNVIIYARRFIFENTGSIKTTPVDPPVAAANAIQHSTTGTVLQPAGNGNAGLKAGDITLNIMEFSAPAGVMPFDLRGGRGQNPGQGVQGLDGSDILVWHSVDQQWVNGWWGYDWSYDCFFWSASITYDPQPGYRVVYLEKSVHELPDPDPVGVHAWPGNGTNGIPGGKPGDGGDGGQLICPVDVSPYSLRTGGAAGAYAGYYYGGREGYPKYAEWGRMQLSRFSDSCYTAKLADHISQAGVGVSSPSADKPQGVTGHFIQSGNPLSSLHPLTLRRIINRARDSYLNRNLSESRALLLEYHANLEAYRSLPAWTALTDQDRYEFMQMHDEMQLLLHRMESNLDYFGNPLGWAPMLSFEVNMAMFDKEIDRALRTLYLTYWVKTKAQTIQQKVDALAATRTELKEQIEEFKDRYAEASDTLAWLQVEAGNISHDIGDMQAKLQDLETRLRQQAEENLEEPWWKTSLKIAGSLCSVIPVGQPALGAIGGGMTLAANFNPDDPWSTVTGAADIAGSFASAQYAQSTSEQENALKKIDTSGNNPETKNPEYLNTISQWSGALSSGISQISTIMAGTKAPANEVEAELQRLMAESQEFQDMSGELKSLLDKKTEFYRRLTAAMQDVVSFSNGINQNLLAIDALNRDVAAGQNVLDERALSYLDTLEQNASDRLIKYHYYMAKAYEYRMLQPYSEPLDLTPLRQKFIDIANLNIGQSQPHVMSADQFLSLKALYEEKIAAVAERIFDTYNSNRPELSAPVRFNLTAEEIEQLNNGQNVWLNLMNIGLFLPSEENIRIVDLKVVDIESHLEGGEFSRWADLNLYMEHDGVSTFQNQGRVLQFRHYNSRTTNPIVWGARYDWHDNLIEPIQPSAASDSLLRSLLSGDASEDMMLYSRPGAWANIKLRKEVNSDNGVDVVLDNVRLELVYDFTLKQTDLANLTVRLSNNDISPYFTLDTEDINGRQDARGAFQRVYQRYSPVTIHAQPYYGEWVFQKWTDQFGYDLDNQAAGDPSIAVDLSQDQTLCAHYVREDTEPIILSGCVTNNNIGLADVEVTLSSGETAITDAYGNYSFPAPYTWSGTITPSKPGYIFNPAVRTLAPVTSSTAHLDFQAESIWQPKLMTSRVSLEFGKLATAEDVLIWNGGSGYLNYRLRVIQGADIFNVTPATGASDGMESKQNHTITVNRTNIPNGYQGVGVLEIYAVNSDVASCYVQLSAENQPEIGLDYLEIVGPDSLVENSGDQFSCLAHYVGGSVADVTFLVSWSDNSSAAMMTMGGYFITRTVDADVTATITAVYGGTSTARQVLIENIPETFTLTAQVMGAGGRISPAGGVFDENEDVALSAWPDAGYQVKSWSNTRDDASTATTNTVLMNDDKVVFLTFEPIPVSLSTQIPTGHGRIVPSGGVYNINTEILVQALPDEGYRVKSWNNTTNDASAQTTNIVKMDASKTVTVEFEEIIYSLAVSVVGQGVYSASSQLCTPNEQAAINVTPATGYRVAQWSGTDNDLSTAKTNTVTMNEDKDVVITFEPIPGNEMTLRQCLVVPLRSGLYNVMVCGTLPEVPASLDNVSQVELSLGDNTIAIDAQRFQKIGLLYLYRGPQSRPGIMLLNLEQETFVALLLNVELHQQPTNPVEVNLNLGDEYTGWAEYTVRTLPKASSLK